MDNSAIAEPLVGKQMLHHEIVAMCVDADVVIVGEGILQGGVHDARCFARTGDAVDGGVWFVVGPLAVVDDGKRPKTYLVI